MTNTNNEQALIIKIVGTFKAMKGIVTHIAVVKQTHNVRLRKCAPPENLLINIIVPSANNAPKKCPAIQPTTATRNTAETSVIFIPSAYSITSTLVGPSGSAFFYFCCDVPR